MSFHPSGFIEFGESLMQLSGLEREPLLRTVVNRCYLAAYMCAKMALEARNHVYDNTSEDYKKVEQDLRNEFGHDGRFMQEQLSLLREKRRKVDYEYPCTDPLDPLFVNHKISVAKHLVAKL